MTIAGHGWHAAAALAVCLGCSSPSHPPDATGCVGCATPPSSILGGGGASVAATSCGHVSPTTVACETCLTESCCAPMLACSTHAACAGLFTCDQTCSTATCTAGCESSFPDGLEDHGSLDACLQSFCAAPCAASNEGGTACGELAAQSSSCGPCIAQSCCAQDSTCTNDPACLSILRCTENCQANDQGCIVSCRSLDENGAILFTAIEQCKAASCAVPCG